MLLSLLLLPFRLLLYVLYFAIAAIIASVLYSVSVAIFDPLRDIPGPFWARFSRFWYVKHVKKGHQHIDEVELHKKYGPIVRIAPGQYSFSDITAAKVIYDFSSKYIKTNFYIPFGAPNSPRPNIFQNTNIDTHAEHRRKISSLYSMTSIVSYEPFVDDSIRACLSQFDQFTKTSQAINVGEWMQYFAADVISAITIGNSYGYLAHGSDFLGVLQELRMGQTYGSIMGSLNGSIHKVLVPMMSKLGKEPPFQAVAKHAEENLKQKRLDVASGKTVQETTGQQDFIEKLFVLEAKGKVDDFDINGTIRSSIAAGSDTTAISLAAIIYYLSHNPSVLAKLRAEVDAHKSKHDDTEFTTLTQAQEMPYLQATIKEAIRLHPAISMQLPRLVPKGGATLSGRFFPAGTTVGINASVIHRQPDLFGADFDQFRPERWLEDEQRAKEMDRCLFAFGAGARICLGKNISMLEMQKLIPELVARYDFDFVDGKDRWEELNRFFVYVEFFCTVKRRGGK